MTYAQHIKDGSGTCVVCCPPPLSCPNLCDDFGETVTYVSVQTRQYFTWYDLQTCSTWQPTSTATYYHTPGSLPHTLYPTCEGAKGPRCPF